jgi:putative PIG3 family NAD(P)H quinone oxidoreductase
MVLPARMISIGISRPGGPEVLLPEDRAVPAPGPRELLIRVAAVGVNRGDAVQREGRYPPPPGASDIPGLEIAGQIVAVGSDVRRYKVGEKVMSLVPGGGYAQYCIAHEAHSLPVPRKLSVVEAASVPETFMTVWHNVFQRGGLRLGETLLIHGGSSGIGVTAIQLAKAYGANVIVTAGSDEKCRACLALGADFAINYRTQDFVAEVKAATRGAGANVILDMVGGDYFEKNFAAASVEGRIVQIGFMDTSVATTDFRQLMAKRLILTGSTLRPRSVTEKETLTAAVEAKVLPLLLDGRFRTVIDSTFPLEQAAEAHRRMEAGLHVGKILLVTGL